MINRREGLYQTGAALGLLALWGFVWSMTTDLPDVAAAYPRFILMLLFGATGIYLLLAVIRLFRPNFPAPKDDNHEVQPSESIWRANDDQPEQLELADDTKAQRKRVAVFMVGVLAYAIAIPYLGFGLSTAIFLVVVFKILMDTKIIALLLLAATPFVLQVVTDVVLGVALPEGIWR